MVIETKVITKEMIKPSSPTPKSLQKHQLSFLDRLAPPIFTHLVYFYQSNPKFPNFQNSDNLKKSLSETLSRFYPLAGRLVGNLYVDCNDAGVPFIEAEENCKLSQIITNKNPKSTYKFVPHNLEEYALEGLCMAVQTTYFCCGGVAVGIVFSHKIGDAVSFLFLVKTWSAVARNAGGAAAIPLPKFDAAAHFPPLDMSGFQPTTGMLREKIAARTITFYASEIAALREKYSTGGRGGIYPSRVEALSAYIWTRFVSATSTRPDPDKTYAVPQTVNLRTRADPPLSGDHFGNIYGLSMAKVAAGDGGMGLVKKVREAAKAVDGNYVARLKEGVSLLNMMKEMMVIDSKTELVWFNFSSLCGFPLYEADFGSGRPVWVWPGGFPYKNLVVFMDTKNGDGIEVLIQLAKQDMKKFEAHFGIQMLKSNL